MKTMSITPQIVQRVAHLARLDLSKEGLEWAQKNLEGIVRWVDQLSAIPTEAVDPIYSVHLKQMPTRADKITDGGKANAVLANAPDESLMMFRVPKFVE